MDNFGDFEFEFEDNEEIQQLVEKYEAALNSESQSFFETEEVEMLVFYYLSKNNYPEALKVVDFGLSQHPTSCELMNQKASIFYNEGQLENSLDILDIILSIEPNNVEAFLFKGEILDELEEYHAAFENYAKAAELGADIGEVGMLISFSCENSGDLTEGIDWLKDALIKEPHNEELLSALALCYQNEGNIFQAFDFYLQYINHQTKDAKAWLVLGNTYASFELFEEAVDAFLNCLELAPETSKAHHGLGNSYMPLEEYKKAADAFNLALAYESGEKELDPTTFYKIGECYLEIKKYHKARSYFLDCLYLGYDFSFIFYKIGKTFEWVEAYEEAINYYEQCLDSYAPSGLDKIYAALGNCHYEIRDLATAVSYYIKSLEENPGCLDSLHELTPILVYNNDIPLATALLKEGLKTGNYTAEIRTLLAGVYFLDGAYTTAETELLMIVDNENYREVSQNIFSYFPSLVDDEETLRILNNLIQNHT